MAAAEAVPAGDLLPWERMDRLGFFRALGGTISLAFQRIDEFVLAVGRRRDLMPALVFGLLMMALSTVVLSLYDVAIFGVSGDAFETLSDTMPWLFGEMDEEPTLRDNLYLRGLMVLLYPLSAFVGSGLVHLLLRAFGQPAGGFAETFRMTNYVAVFDVLAVVPACGAVLAFAWQVVVLVRGLARIHRMGTAPVLAALLLPVLVLGCFGALILAVFDGG